VLVASAVALSEKVPDPELRPHGLRLARGDLVDLRIELLDCDRTRALRGRIRASSRPPASAKLPRSRGLLDALVHGGRATGSTCRHELV